ncbi:phosphatidyl serine synthase-domain-containing protein [Mycena leptocephala]|nr:phosphatidyl serine synthase-domain-containing protein [Mycena leptocephala]
MSSSPSTTPRDEPPDPTELSATNDDSDAVLSPPPDAEPEPFPGIDGTPVRLFSTRVLIVIMDRANRAEPYTRITPFQERHDTSVEFFYKPITLTALAGLLVLLAYLAMTQDVLEEGRDKRRVGIYASLTFFLLFSTIQFRDGPFIRPHPALWRTLLGVNLLYELALVFLLFQDLGSARGWMVLLDDKLGVPLPEKGYADDCSLTPSTLWNALDVFCVAHTLGWFGKAMILRDYWFCWILSIAFELAEYSLQHQLPNFNECWWDHWILDVLVCNWIGTYLGMKVCQYFEVKPYSWRGLRQTRGLRSKARRVFSQFSPHDFTAFKWGTASSFRNYISVVLLLAVFLAAELNPFYLKSLLWLEPEHPIVILRLAFIFLCALPAVRELFQYVNDPRRAVRMGQHVWLLLATVVTELLVIFKWSKGQFPTPLPRAVKIGWGIGLAMLVGYPVVQFGIPATRPYTPRRRGAVLQHVLDKHKDEDSGRPSYTVRISAIQTPALGHKARIWAPRCPRGYWVPYRSRQRFHAKIPTSALRLSLHLRRASPPTLPPPLAGLGRGASEGDAVGAAERGISMWGRRVRAGPPLRDLIKKRFGSDSEDGGKVGGVRKTENGREDGRWKKRGCGEHGFPRGKEAWEW